MQMTVRLPRPVWTRIARIANDRVRQFVMLVMHDVFSPERHSRFVHSQVARKILGTHLYPAFLKVMNSFSDLVVRTKSYMTAQDSTATQVAHSKAFVIRDPQAIDHIMVSRSYGSYPVSCWFVARVRKAIDWYHDVWLVNKCGVDIRKASDVLRENLQSLGFDEVTRTDAEAVCSSPEQADLTLNKVDLINKQGASQDIGCDGGRRFYHDLTNMKKEIRARCLLDGEAVVSIDMHATFVAVIAGRLSMGEERDRLIAMLQTGDFYREFAKLTGLNSADVKARFQRDVVFSRWRPGNVYWETFKKHFPNTARAISQIRDHGHVVRFKCKQDKNGRRFTQKTTLGQLNLSRSLTRTESDIFGCGAMVALHDLGIKSLPIHDCLMVPARHAQAAYRVIGEFAERVLGFAPVLKATNRFGERIPM